MRHSREFHLLRALGAVLLVAVLVGLCSCASCGRRERRPPPDPYPVVAKLPPVPSELAVLLFETQTPVLLGAERGVVLSLPRTGETLGTVPELRDVGASPVPAGVLLGARVFETDRLLLAPEKDSLLVVSGRKYRGSLLLIRTADGSLLGVNRVGIEEYLPSVLGAEVPSRWPIECLKAQAIAARTYALWKARQREGGSFLLYADSRDQNYRGLETETAASREAVEATRGAIATFEGRLFPTFFFSTCGDQTEPVDLMLNLPLIPPLRGVKCGFCTESKYYRWQASFSAAQVRDAILRDGYDIGDVQSIRTDSGRPALGLMAIVLRGDHSEVAVPAEVFRSKLGADVVRSVMFEAHREGESLVFEGRGWGHLVGLCQWGARGMAGQGYYAGEIVRHYYPGSEIVRMY